MEKPGEENVNLEERKTQVTEKLQKREEERLDEVKRRKDEKESASVLNESTTFFLDNFSRTKSDIEEKLTNSGSVEKAGLTAHFDDIFVLLQKLTKYLTDSAMFIPAFEVQKAQQTISKWTEYSVEKPEMCDQLINDTPNCLLLLEYLVSPCDITNWFQSVRLFADKLQTDVQEKRDELIPKKKFAFKGKKKTEKAAPAPTTETAKKEIKVAISECNFADAADQTLTKCSEEVTNQDVALTRLSNCVVKLHGSPGAMHVSNLKNCKVFSGPVSGSIFIDQCAGCLFVMPCQQMRIHSTTSTDFYIHVTSKAIIEDCQMVRFAPYNWLYPNIEEHYAISKLDRHRNNWNDVDDFNWLASDSHSPNWKELPEEDRIKQWDE